MDREHLCHDCGCVRNSKALDICKELGHDIDEGDDYKGAITNKELGIPIKTKSKKKSPNVKKIVKGKFENIFVESIYIDGVPHFLANVNGEIKFSERFEIDGTVIEPIKKEDSPYNPYEFSKMELNLLRNNPPTKEKILEKIELIIKKYIDTTENNKTVIQIDTFLTYCQDQIDTVHFLFVVGDTESGKSTIGHLIKELGYRVQYQTDLNYAGIYNFYGIEEEATGTIIEDEAQDLDIAKNKIRLYKNSYTRGSKIAIVVGKDTANQKHQVYYNTFGFKVFIGEEIPSDKGFRERLVILRMNTGFPEGNIKRVSSEEKIKLNLLRNELLFYKVLNIKKHLPQVHTGLSNRDEELFADFIKIGADTKYEKLVKEVVKQYTKERHESIHNSFESRLFELIVIPMDERVLIIFEDFWKYFTEEQDTIKGRLDKETFFSHDFGKISRYRIAQILTDKFQAKKEVIHKEKKQITAYMFNPKTLSKLVEKYNISLPIEHMLYRDTSTLETKDEL